MNESVSLITLIIQASTVVKLVMALLLVLSVVSWVIIFHLTSKIGSAARFDERFKAWFWTDSIDKQLAVVNQESQRMGLEAIFYAGLTNLDHSLSTAQKTDIVERRFRVALGVEQAHAERGLSTLATIGSISPYIGLFGTVWGIMNAFIGLGQANAISLATVAPSIAEALIATALGLFAAIPASMAFNHFTAKANALYESRSLFCESLMSTLLAQFAKTETSPSHATGTTTHTADTDQGAFHGNF
ncbi:MotA/TolQ/ExbB proton channel family protein [Moraxella marmotae]|uniref:MotA/TolQ/ExbB proton channel family protein n=1 Tax=Moraxella marmotae TaxID=3344520 RepID=UPI0035F39CFE